MNGLPYYKAYPRDFIEGTVGMPFEVKSAYRIVLDLIYMRGGDLPDDPRYIAGVLGCSVRAWKKYREALVEAGKLTIADGSISNSRADKELETSRSFQDKQAENRRRPNKNKTLQSPRSHHTDTDTDTEEKEETTVSSKKKGSRLSPEWRLPKAWGEWAMAEGAVEVEVRREADKFRDYWLGVAGSKGVKLDWQATWRNWIRKAVADRKTAAPARLGEPRVGETRRTADGRLQRYNGKQDGWFTIHEDDDADSMGDFARGWDQHTGDDRNAAGDMPGMQSVSEAQGRQVSIGDVQARRSAVAVSSLRLVGGAVV